MEVLTKKQKEGNSDDMSLYCDIFKAHIQDIPMQFLDLDDPACRKNTHFLVC